MTAPEFHLPRIGRDPKHPNLDFSDKSFALSNKLKNTIETYQATPQPRKYQNILQSILHPKPGAPDPRTLASFNKNTISNNDESNTPVDKHVSFHENRPLYQRLRSKNDKRNLSIDLQGQRMQLPERKPTNLFKLNTPVQTEATPVSKKFTVLQNEKYYGIGANKTDRYDQNNTTIDSSFSFFKSQEKSTEGFKEFLASVRAERPKNPRSRGNIVSSSLEVPKTDLSVNSSKPDNLRTMRRPAKGFYRSLIRPDDQMKPKVNLQILVLINECLKKMTEVARSQQLSPFNSSIIYQNWASYKEMVKHCKMYLELIDKQEFFGVDVFSLDSITRRDFKTFIILERLAIFVMLSIIEDDFKSAQPSQVFSDLAEALYTNFGHFLDMILYKVRLTQKESVWYEELTTARANSKVGTGVVGSCNDKIIRCLKSLKFSENQPNERINYILNKMNHIPLKESYESMKLLFSGVVANWKINVEFTNQNWNPEITALAAQITAKRNKSTEDKNAVEKRTITEEKPSSKEGKNARLATVTESSEPNPNANISSLQPKSFLKQLQPQQQTQRPSSSLKHPKQIEILQTVTKDSPKKGYLPPIDAQKAEKGPVYSLVLDLDETLVHYEEVGGKGKFFVRPYAELFLRELSEYYEIIVFTAAMQEYADLVLDIFDKKRYIEHRLYRQHTIFPSNTGGVIKDLSKIGRDLSRVIIIDNSPDNFVLQPDNGIEIKSWFSDPYDQELLNLIPFLKSIVLEKTEDVRETIKNWKENKRINC